VLLQRQVLVVWLMRLAKTCLLLTAMQLVVHTTVVQIAQCKTVLLALALQAKSQIAMALAAQKAGLAMATVMMVRIPGMVFLSISTVLSLIVTEEIALVQTNLVMV